MSFPHIHSTVYLTKSNSTHRGTRQTIQDIPFTPPQPQPQRSRQRSREHMRSVRSRKIIPKSIPRPKLQDERKTRGRKTISVQNSVAKSPTEPNHKSSEFELDTVFLKLNEIEKQQGQILQKMEELKNTLEIN